MRCFSMIEFDQVGCGVMRYEQDEEVCYNEVT
jgi:hypothetical protein